MSAMPTTGHKTILGRTLMASRQVERMVEEAPALDKLAPQFEQKILAVLFSDIVGSTAFFEQRGDEQGMAMVERHNRLLFPIIQTNEGTIVKTIGDAIMASFPSASSAVQCAVAMQQGIKEHNLQQPESDRITIRIGINFGSVICRDRDLFGDVVNAAARIESLASGRKILISASIRSELGSLDSLPLVSYDAVLVKGKQKPLEVLEVLWDPDALTQEALNRRLSPGTLLGNRFEILDSLGDGGMGQVYRSKDKALDDVVALKFIRDDLARNSEIISHFKQEVKIARSITHRNICRIHEFLQMDQYTFLSMELVQGRTLEKFIEEHAPFTPDKAIEIIAEICEGLHQAHQRGITHRDLKPANVMLEDQTERTVIMDFGIAQAISSHQETNFGTIVGTPEYMPPEQAQGLKVRPTADVYALGAILYEMLTGHPPFEGPTAMAVAIKHLTEEPLSPRSINSTIAPALETIVLRCLAKEPGQRFADAGQLLHALKPNLPISAEQSKKSKRLSIAIWAVVFMVVMVLSFFLLNSAENEQPISFQSSQSLESTSSVEHNGRWSPDDKFIAFLKDSEVWIRSFPQDQFKQRISTSNALLDLDMSSIAWTKDSRNLLVTSSDKSGLELLRVSAAGNTPDQRVQSNAAEADVSPEGNQAWIQKNNMDTYDLVISDASGSDPQVVLAGTSSFSFLRPRWSPDGKMLALVKHTQGYTSTKDIGIWNLKSKKFQLLTQDGVEQRANNTDPTWSPDGKWVVYVSQRSGTGCLWMVPAKGGKSVPITQGSTEHQRGPDVSHTGSSILFNTYNRHYNISVAQIGTNEIHSVTDDRFSDHRFPVWSPNGQLIAFRSQRNGQESSSQRIVLFNLEKNQEIQTLEGPPGLRDFSWCGPHALAFASTQGQSRQLGILDWQTNQTQTLVKDFYRIWGPSANPDCTQVVFYGQQRRGDLSRLWMAAVTKPQVRLLLDQDGVETYPSWSPDGKWIAYRWSRDNEHLGESQLRSVLATGKQMRVITEHLSFQRSLRRIRWSSDGRFLYFLEAITPGGRLWKVPIDRGLPIPLVTIDDIHTFDFDLSPSGEQLIYSREILLGDLYLLRSVRWNP